MQRSRFVSSLLSLSLCLGIFAANVQPCVAVELSGSVADEAQLLSLTKQALLKGAEVGRFILRYRLENVRPPKTRLLRYSLMQEAGYSTALAFEIIADQQFGINRRTPLRLNKTSLDHAFDTALPGSIIAGSSSAFELSANFMRQLKNKRAGFDSRSAQDTFMRMLGEFDALVDQRERLTETETGRLKEILTLENKIMRSFHDRMVTEFVLFNKASVRSNSYENTYFALNAATNAVASVSEGVGIKSLSIPHFGGPSNVLFLIAGALTMASPGLSTGTAALVGLKAQRTMLKRLGLKELPKIDDVALENNVKRVKELSAEMAAERIALAGPVIDRMGIYSTASERFRSLVDAQEHRDSLLRQVAVQSSYLGPVIGATFLTQGILGTDSYFNYQRKPIRLSKLRTSVQLNFAGSVTGTVGAGIATAGTPLLLAAALAYRYREGKKRQLPWQLLEDRIVKLGEVEDSIKQMPVQ